VKESKKQRKLVLNQKIEALQQNTLRNMKSQNTIREHKQIQVTELLFNPREIDIKIMTKAINQNNHDNPEALSRDFKKSVETIAAIRAIQVKEDQDSMKIIPEKELLPLLLHIESATVITEQEIIMTEVKDRHGPNVMTRMKEGIDRSETQSQSTRNIDLDET